LDVGWRKLAEGRSKVVALIVPLFPERKRERGNPLKVVAVRIFEGAPVLMTKALGRWEIWKLSCTTAQNLDAGGIARQTHYCHSPTHVQVAHPEGLGAHGAPQLGPSPPRPCPGPHIHGPAHRGANGAAMPTDEDDQDCHFFFNHPERGGLLRCLGARSPCCCCLYPSPPLRGGVGWGDFPPAPCLCPS